MIKGNFSIGVLVYWYIGVLVYCLVQLYTITLLHYYTNEVVPKLLRRVNCFRGCVSGI